MLLQALLNQIGLGNSKIFSLIAGKQASMTEYDVNIFKKVIDMNLMGVYYGMCYVYSCNAETKVLLMMVLLLLNNDIGHILRIGNTVTSFTDKII